MKNVAAIFVAGKADTILLDVFFKTNGARWLFHIGKITWLEFLPKIKKTHFRKETHERVSCFFTFFLP